MAKGIVNIVSQGNGLALANQAQQCCVNFAQPDLLHGRDTTQQRDEYYNQVS
jgi:hypothetical protein